MRHWITTEGVANGKNLIDIEDIPPQLANKVKQDLRFKTGNFVWRVRFNIPLDPHTVNKDTMYVTNSQNQKLRSYIRYDTKMRLSRWNRWSRIRRTNTIS